MCNFFFSFLIGYKLYTTFPSLNMYKIKTPETHIFSIVKIKIFQHIVLPIKLFFSLLLFLLSISTNITIYENLKQQTLKKKIVSHVSGTCRLNVVFMGIGPDLSAIRNAKIQEKKLRKTTKRVYTSLVKKEESLQELSNQKDQDELQTIRRTEMRSLLNELVEQGLDEPDVVIGDAEAFRAWKIQNVQESIKERLGDSFQKSVESLTVPSLPSNVPHSLQDSDGDLDITHLKQEHEKQVASKVIYRDQDGFKITKEKWLELQQEKKGGYKVKKTPSKGLTKQEPVKWGKGIYQEKERAEREAFEKQIAEEPLTQYEIRDKYDKELRSKIYWADPMGHQLNQESDANEPRVKCPFPSPPNRFNILAGYRWDGVIRGNGFESRFLQEKNKVRFQETEAYKWSIEDT